MWKHFYFSNFVKDTVPDWHTLIKCLPFTKLRERRNGDFWRSFQRERTRTCIFRERKCIPLIGCHSSSWKSLFLFWSPSMTVEMEGPKTSGMSPIKTHKLISMKASLTKVSFQKCGGGIAPTPPPIPSSRAVLFKIF